jgi:hypothetical protein
MLPRFSACLLRRLGELAGAAREDARGGASQTMSAGKQP